MSDTNQFQDKVTNYIKEKYLAAGADDAEFRLSTKDIYAKIEKAFPNVISKETLTEFLMEHYQFHDNELEFVWLFKSK